MHLVNVVCVCVCVRPCRRVDSTLCTVQSMGRGGGEETCSINAAVWMLHAKRHHFSNCHYSAHHPCAPASSPFAGVPLRTPASAPAAARGGGRRLALGLKMAGNGRAGLTWQRSKGQAVDVVSCSPGRVCEQRVLLTDTCTSQHTAKQTIQQTSPSNCTLLQSCELPPPSTRPLRPCPSPVSPLPPPPLRRHPSHRLSCSDIWRLYKGTALEAAALGVAPQPHSTQLYSARRSEK